MDHEVEKLIREAIDALKSGRADEALLVLERTVDHKFYSFGDAYSKYYDAMSLKATA